MEIIINRIAIWRANFSDKFSVRQIPKNTKYLDEKSGVYVISDEVMYRYAKNYTKGKTKYCLFVRTFRDDKAGIESELDKVAKTITEDYAKKINALATIENFEYLDKYVKGEN